MQQLGPYRLIERLGVGGMAEVFLARSRGYDGFEKDQVVKVLHARHAGDESFARMLAAEARLTARLNHVNIVPVVHVGRHEDTVYVVMEYVDGRDLHSTLVRVVQSGRQFPVEIAAYAAREACAGLHYAHTRHDEHGAPLNLVHRDVSPHNVLLGFEGEVRLIDFGVARFDSVLREKTRAGVIKGKFGYMSPEQAWDRPLDGRSDVFSIGIVLYELLTGRSVYGQSDDPVTMIRKVRQADIAPPTTWRPDLPPRLEAIVMRAIAADPNDRYASAREMQIALTGFLAQHAPLFTPLDAGLYLRALFDDAAAPGAVAFAGADGGDDGTMPDADVLALADADDRTHLYDVAAAPHERAARFDDAPDSGDHTAVAVAGRGRHTVKIHDRDSGPVPHFSGPPAAPFQSGSMPAMAHRADSSGDWPVHREPARAHAHGAGSFQDDAPPASGRWPTHGEADHVAPNGLASQSAPYQSGPYRPVSDHPAAGHASPNYGPTGRMPAVSGEAHGGAGRDRGAPVVEAVQAVRRWVQGSATVRTMLVAALVAIVFVLIVLGLQAGG